MTKPMINKTRNSVRKRTGFECPFCGNDTSKPREYFSSLAEILTYRFLKLLNTENRIEYIHGVLDCIYEVFGSQNRIMRRRMERAGFLEKYDQQHAAKADGVDYSPEGKHRCCKCGQFKNDWELSIECISSIRHVDICEDCVSKNRQ